MCIFRSRLCLLLNVLACIVRVIHGQSAIIVAPKEIPTGGALQSKNGRFLLAMQYDCNLVLYDLEKNRLPLWATNTSGHGANCYAAMEINGNFVLYNGAHMIKFQTYTYIYSCTGNYLAWMQDDGNFVVYCEPTVNNLQQLTALWATGTDGWWSNHPKMLDS